jgi:prepilin-type N-terminal cleavage/methylation domain-containing protein
MLQVFTRRLRSERGFTLIELLIVVAIIAILAAILIPNFLRARAQAQVAATKGNLKNTATALESYFVDFASYPGSSTNLTANYTRALASDPCSGTAFGTSPGYTYSPVGGGPTYSDYVLRSNWAATAGPGSSCYSVGPAGSGNIQYTPGGGLANTP